MIQTLAARIAAQRAILGRTIAGSRIYDSAISAIDELVEDNPMPVVILSIEEETTTVQMLDVLAGTRKAMLIVEIAIASAVSRTFETEEGAQVTERTIEIPPTDGGLEMSLAILGREVMRALFDLSTDWSRVFCGVVHRIEKITMRRGADAVREGLKFAARQIAIEFEPYAEPPFGAALEAGTPLHAFVAQAKLDASLGGFAGALEATIVGDELPDWQVFYRQMIVNDAQAEAIGLAPVILTDQGVPPVVQQVDYGSALGPITEAAADQYLPPEEEP